MNVLDIVTIILLCLLGGAHCLRRPFLVRHKTLMLTLIGLSIFSILALQAYIQYEVAALSPAPIKYLVPPYAPISAFAHTVWSRIFAPYAFSAVLGAIIYFIVTKIRFFSERLHETEALYITTTFFLMRHPYWIPYLASLLALAILAAIYGTLRHGKEYRFSLYHLWIPSGILAVLAFPLFQKLSFFVLIGFPNLY